MSYRMIGLGGAKAAEQCQGGEVSEDGLGNRGDHCCKVDTWSSVTYREVKGNTSWRRWREKLIRLALEHMLGGPSDMGMPTRIHQEAFNVGLNENVAVTPELLNRVQTALHNFNVLYPFSRWYKKSNCRKGDYDDGVCTGGDRTLSCWKSNPPPHTPEVAALLSRVVGSPVSVQNLQTVREWEWVPPLEEPKVGGGLFSDFYKEDRQRWLQVPSQFAAWAKLMHAIITTMPGSGSHQLSSYRIGPKPGDLFHRSGHLLVPSPWLESFIVALSPKGVKLKVVPGMRVLAPKPKPKVTISKAHLQRVVTPRPTEEGTTAPPSGARDTPEAEPEGMDPKVLAIGGVAVIALGFGAFVMMRKGR